MSKTPISSHPVKSSAVDHSADICVQVRQDASFLSPEHTDTATAVAAEASTNVPRRWLILCLASLMLAGQFYVYDNPAALAPTLSKHLHIPPPQAAYLVSACYAVYAFPNILLPFLGGVALDKYGLRFVLLSAVLAVLVGQLIFAVGLSLPGTNSNVAHDLVMTILLIGRAVMGGGGEILGVATTRIITICFDGRQLAFALALLLSLARIGSVLNANVTSFLAYDVSVEVAVWCGTFFMFLSTFAALAVSVLLRRHAPLPALLGVQPCLSPRPPRAVPAIARYRRLGRDLLQFYRRNISPLPRSFWFLATLGTFLSSSILPFINIANGMMREKWFPNDETLAGAAMGFPDLLSFFLVPLFGIMMLKFPRHAVPLCLASIFMLIAHVLLLLPFLFSAEQHPVMHLLYQMSPFGPLVILATGYSLYGVALWPAIAKSVAHLDATLLLTENNDSTTVGVQSTTTSSSRVTSRSTSVPAQDDAVPPFAHPAFSRIRQDTPRSPLVRSISFPSPILRSVPFPPPPPPLLPTETLSRSSLRDVYLGPPTPLPAPASNHISDIDIDNPDDDDDDDDIEDFAIDGAAIARGLDDVNRADERRRLLSSSSSTAALLPTSIVVAVADAPQHDLTSIAYGLVTSLINLALTVIPVLIARAINWVGYLGAEILLTGLSACAVIVSLLYIVSKKKRRPS